MKCRTRLVVILDFEQDRLEGDVAKPDELIAKEIEEAFDCKAKILVRTDMPVCE